MCTKRSIVLLLALALSFAANPFVAQDAADAEPLDLGLTEQTGTSLMFLDVEVTDKEGRPRPGLVKDDFKITINYTRREIYSVDDLCACASPSATEIAGRSPEERAVLEARSSKPYYVLYLDFSQLQMDGRDEALIQARRWVEEVMLPDDRAQLVAFTSQAGLRRLTPFTGDREQLLLALDVAAADPDLVDPFPSLIWERRRMCREGYVSCYNTGKKEWMQTRRSLRMLRNYLTGLDEIPQRKVLMIFHQNISIFPGRLYALTDSGLSDDPSYLPNVDKSVNERLDEGLPIRATLDAPSTPMLDGSESGLVPDVLELMDVVGGTATASRTSVYPMVCGARQGWNVNLGANLADATGGRFNRGSDDLVTLLDQAGRGCACIYRIGIRVPDRNKSKLYRTKVRVEGKPLPVRHRVQYLTAADRWLRKAEAVLSRPQDEHDVGIIASLLPVRSRKGRWDLKAQVALDVDTLLKLPSGEREEAGWEVGALMADGQGARTWDMLGVSRMRRDLGEPVESDVIHERLFEGLRPGRYELRAFVRDRTANLYGGGRADIVLPAAGETGIAGPLIRYRDGKQVVANLPLREAKTERKPTAATSRRGEFPADIEGIPAGQRLDLLSWVCPAVGGSAAKNVQRNLSTEAGRSIPLNNLKSRRAGDCMALVERLDTTGLAAGDYTYRLSLPPATSEISFRVTSGLRRAPGGT